jgi:glycolate oxidase FAD binding subunit
LNDGTAARIEQLVGAAGLRAGTPDDAVNGVAPAFVVEPESEETVSAILRLANEEKLCVVPRGGGSKIQWGGRPERVDVLLSLRRLNRVLEHSAGDLTLVAEAGATLVAVNEVIAEAGQFLALDSPFADRATLGGIVSANTAGPLRRRYGGVRDQLIGVTLARADGTIAKAGGKVVKNVAGYDLMKLLTGAFGTLGVITRTAFRLYPVPEASSMLVVPIRPDHLRSLIVAMIGSSLVPAAVSLVDLGEGPAPVPEAFIAIRYATVEPAVRDQLHATTHLLDGLGLTHTTIMGEEEATLWRKIGADVWQNPDTLLAKASLLPVELPVLLGLVEDYDGALLADALDGVAYLALPGDAGRQAAAFTDIRTVLRPKGGSLVLLDAAPAAREQVDVWGVAASPALTLQHRVKDAFDPNRICSPGRFVGGM